MTVVTLRGLNRDDSDDLGNCETIRRMTNPAPLHDESPEEPRDAGFIPSDRGLENESHVLLAACGEDETAGEHSQEQHGVFTSALLRAFEENPIQSFSYRSLLLSLRLKE